MRKRVVLCASMLIFAACNNEDHKISNNQKARTAQESRESSQKFEPPKPNTKGAFDFTECEEKHGSDTENFRACVKARYPNIKFAE